MAALGIAIWQTTAGVWRSPHLSERMMELNRKRFLSICCAVMPTLASLTFSVATVNALAQTPLAGVVKISAGSFHTCALTSGGGVKCWGISNQNFQTYTAVDVPGLSSGVAAIAAGDQHTCALTTLGGVKCWGLNSKGQIGDNGPITYRLTPTDVSGLTSGVTAISAGLLTTCAVTSTGGAKCWGANGVGQLGDGTTADSPVPVDVFGLASGVSAIATYNGHSCALTTIGGIKCWGQNNSGQLGTGFPPTSSLVPVDVISAQSMPALTGASAIAVNFASSCALNSGGALCWGDGSVGQLGNNNFLFSSNVPVPVLSGASQPPLAGVTAIAAGRSHACALTTVGNLKCWGFNTSGQLGDGNNLNHESTPVDVIAGPALPLSGVTAVSAGEAHTCALMNNGGVKCWGANFTGALGNDDGASYHFTPVDVLVVPPVALTGVVSRKPHGATGPFDLALDRVAPIHSSVTVEPRTIGAGHAIVFNFDGAITNPGSVKAVDGTGAAIFASAPAIEPGNGVSVTIFSADKSRATISLTGVNGYLAGTVSIGFLLGDVNNSGSVNAIDTSAVKARAGQTTDLTNFRFDVNATGAINSSDISAVKARATNTLSP